MRYLKVALREGGAQPLLPRPQESCRVKDQRLAPTSVACSSDFTESLETHSAVLP